MSESEMDHIKFFGKKFVGSVFDQKRIECITTRKLSFCISLKMEPTIKKLIFLNVDVSET